MVAIDLRTQQALDADPKVIKLVSFTVNLNRAGDTTMIFSIEETSYSRFWIRNYKSFVN